ncbi:hypothetical protein PG984_013395 [Apiospora sp. TS-2023a]
MRKVLDQGQMSTHNDDTPTHEELTTFDNPCEIPVGYELDWLKSKFEAISHELFVSDEDCDVGVVKIIPPGVSAQDSVESALPTSSDNAGSVIQRVSSTVELRAASATTSDISSIMGGPWMIRGLVDSQQFITYMIP